MRPPATVFPFLLMTTAALGQSPPPPTPPPVAPVRPVVDTYHATKVTDPYRYMEDLKDPEVSGWMKAQSAHTETVLDQLPGRRTLLQRIQELDKGAPFTIGGLRRLENGALFYRKLEAGAETPVIAARASLAADETIVLDPKSYETPGGAHASLEFFSPAPDGRHAVVGIAKGGSEVTTLFVRDLATGKDLPVSIDRIETAYNTPQWLPDSTGFFYSRRQPLPPGTPASETYKNTVASLHLLGHSVDQDTPVFGKDLSAAVPFAPLDFPSVWIAPGSSHAIGQIHHGDAQELTLYSAPLETLSAQPIAWRKICGVDNGVIDFAVHGGFVYLVTADQAPRYRVVRTPVAQPDFAKAEVVLPESDLVVMSVHPAKDAVFVNTTLNGAGVVVQLDPTGSRPPKRLAPPPHLTASVAEASPHFRDVFIATESWTRGRSLHTFDPARSEFQRSPLQPQGKYDDVPGYASKQVEVPSHDGALVPLSIIYREGVAFDGTAPMILNGYGAYGSIRTEGFSPVNLAWLERGGLIAIAHVRGGGEKGKQWHLDGQKTTKPNTWKDLIACAEYLIAQQYTSTPKLAIQGGSAGGILIGRALTERPDLFGAAIINVGCTDLLRMETTENGPPNIEEFGTVATPEGFAALHAMSPLHQVQDRVNYPAVLLTHGLNDRRVDAWMSGKMTARLQAATASGNPVLLLLDPDAGHGIGSKRSQIHSQLASRWAFVLWRAGDPDFQPAQRDR
jgi:prolyl oligopeptidase